MATYRPNTNKQGEVISYKVKICLGRDDKNKQIQRTTTIPRPEGLTPAKERKEVERLAEQWEREQRAEFEKTQSKEDKKRITLADFINKHWFSVHVEDGGHTPSTVSFYRIMSADILAYFGNRKRLAQIDAEAVKRYIKFLNTEARTQSGEPYSPATVQHHFNTLRSILEYARRFRYVDYNPCSDLAPQEKPKRDKKRIDFLTPEDAKQFINALEREPLFWRCFGNLLITTGLRRGEAVGLQWGDIDPDKLTITVQRNVTIDRNAPDKYHIGATKTGEIRTVPIPPRVLALLEELKREQQQKYSAILLPSAFIFCRTEAPYMPIYPTEPTRWQRKFTERYNLPKVSPHDLRHTAATLALESGANLKQVQALMGHSDPGTTMKFYAGVTEAAQRRTVEGIEKLLAEAK